MAIRNAHPPGDWADRQSILDFPITHRHPDPEEMEGRPF